MSLAQYIHAMGRGPSRARSLTRAEATDAMAQILEGTAAPEAVGALLVLMRYRGETAEEVAGFTDAARQGTNAWKEVPAALDWPSYAAGRSRGLPWFLLSAMLVARSGQPVLLHGWNSHQGISANVRDAAIALGIPVARTPDSAKAALDQGGIAYAPLEVLNPDLLRLLRLRNVLGLRSAVNTVCRMLNPCQAETTIQGVFHPSYRTLQQDAARLLDQTNQMVIKGGGGEFERHPAKPCAMFGLRGGTPFEDTADPLVEDHRRLAQEDTDLPHLLNVWASETRDPWAEEVVIGTAALALLALRSCTDNRAATAEATQLWKTRQQKLAA